MRKEIVFIAEDGEEFESEEDCLEHEDMVTAGFKENQLIIYDELGKKISGSNFSYDQYNEMNQNAKFISVNSEAGVETLIWLGNEFGHCCPCELGFWFYNDKTDKWEDAEEFIMRVYCMKMKV